MPDSGNTGRKKWLKDRESSKLIRQASSLRQQEPLPTEKTGDKCKLIGLGRQARSLEKVKLYTELKDWEGGRSYRTANTGLWDSGMESENSAVQENSRHLLAQAFYNCSLPSSGCGYANRLTGSPAEVENKKSKDETCTADSK